MKHLVTFLTLFSVAAAVPTLNSQKVVDSENATIEGRDIIGTIMDTLACRSTSQFGFNGRCVPRSCCQLDNGVDNLCSQAGFVCCYSGNRCEENLFPIYQPHYPINSHRDWCDRVVTRYDWEAIPAIERPRPMRHRAEKVIVHHTGRDSRRCDSPRSCGEYLRFLQDIYQREKNFPDIAWNFIINDYGEVFEGVGWGYEGYHTAGENHKSLGVSFVGDFNRYHPTSSALQAFESLMECGINREHLRRNYGIWGHSDFNRDTNCPGRHLYRELTNMLYFNQNILSRDAQNDTKSATLDNTKSLNVTIFHDS